MRRWGRRVWMSWWFRVPAIVVLVLVVLGFVADRAFDRPLRGIVERRMNQNLEGYTARVGAADFHLIGFALELERVIVVQNAHPDPPVMQLPRLRMSVHWTDLLYGRLVADATFWSPTINANLVQLQEESRDPVPLQQRGWQRALESIYPLKINELKITRGEIVYDDESDFEPLHLSDVDLVAGNIRNVRSRDRTYPSTFRAEARAFDVGRVEIDGHADFLAEPSPGVQGVLELDLVELKYFQPMAKELGLTIRSGLLSALGQVEWGPGIQHVDIHDVQITGASVDYASGLGATPEAKTAGREVARVAKTSLNDPEILFRVRRLSVHDGRLRVISQNADLPYKLDFSNAYLSLDNLSSRAEDGPARLGLDGAFMGKGRFEGNAVFFPEGKHANLEGKVAVRDTPLESMNDLLRAKGKFDVNRGTFELYSEFRVRDGAIEGYVKPLFRDIEVLDSEQDKGKNIFRKMYEGIVGGVAKLLENEKGEVATVTSLAGPLDNPQANAMEALGGLLRNAFVKSILPGFLEQIRHAEPARYRAAMKKAKKEEKKKAKEREKREDEPS